jgi:dTDP-4-dehydrorhamnose reductase
VTVVVTGATGQVGREIVRRARAGGLDVRALGRRDLDVTRAQDVDAALADTAGLSVVLNAAAFTDVDAAESRSAEAFRVNRDGPANLARGCREAGVPLVHLSTDHVFSGDSAGPCLETDVPAPVNEYGRSKLAGEEAVRGALREHVILRTSWVFGCEGDNFVLSMLRLARERETLDVVGDEDGCPTGAGQVADAVLSVARRVIRGEAPAWGTFHYAGRPCVSRAELARRIFDEARGLGGLPCAGVREIRAREFASAAARPARVVLDGRRARAELGLEPPDWRPYLTATLSALRRAAST